MSAVDLHLSNFTAALLRQTYVGAVLLQELARYQSWAHEEGGAEGLLWQIFGSIQPADLQQWLAEDIVTYRSLLATKLYVRFGKGIAVCAPDPLRGTMLQAITQKHVLLIAQYQPDAGKPTPLINGKPGAVKHMHHYQFGIGIRSHALTALSAAELTQSMLADCR